MSVRRDRWNSIGRTRRKLAEILTAYARTVTRLVPLDPRVDPEDIYPMRLAGKARIWEDAHSWEASVTTKDGRTCWAIMSYSTMTECVKAGRVRDVDSTNEAIHEVSA